jgi:hypothetical protein
MKTDESAEHDAESCKHLQTAFQGNAIIVQQSNRRFRWHFATN